MPDWLKWLLERLLPAPKPPLRPMPDKNPNPKDDTYDRDQ